MPGNFSVIHLFPKMGTSGGYNAAALKRFELREIIGLQQVCIIDLLFDKRYTLPDDGAPVRVAWGNNHFMRRFEGYVHHSEHVPKDGHDVLRVFLSGTSFVMNSPRSQTWSNATASSIAKDVANAAGLRCVLHKARRVIPFTASGVKGDFALLSKLANEEGFLLWVDGGTLFFLDPLVMFSANNGFPTFTLTTRVENGPNGQEFGNLLEVRGWHGPLAGFDDASATQQVYGVDEANGRVIFATSDKAIAGLPDSILTKVSATTASSTAQAHFMNAAAAKSNQWDHLRVLAYGDPKHSLGKIAILAGNSLSDDQKGDWLVKGVTHVMQAATDHSPYMSYKTEIDLARQTRTGTAFAHTTNVNAFSTVDAVLNTDGQWVSPMRGEIYV